MFKIAENGQIRDFMHYVTPKMCVSICRSVYDRSLKCEAKNGRGIVIALCIQYIFLILLCRYGKN